VIADDGASPAGGQGVQAPKRQPAVLSIPVALAPGQGPGDGPATETRQGAAEAPVLRPAGPAAAAAVRQPARHRGGPKHPLPRRVAALWARARDAISAP
jgi:hypothetical protein